MGMVVGYGAGAGYGAGFVYEAEAGLGSQHWLRG